MSGWFGITLLKEEVYSEKPAGTIPSDKNSQQP